MRLAADNAPPGIDQIRQTPARVLKHCCDELGAVTIDLTGKLRILPARSSNVENGYAKSEPIARLASGPAEGQGWLNINFAFCR
jgi:hypothetical protein